jgi:hypothetical protein
MRFIKHSWKTPVRVAAGLCFATASYGAQATASAATTSVQDHIKADWEAFFAGRTPATRKIALVQDGSSFAAVIRSQSGSPLAESVTAKVSKIVVAPSKKTATVSYSVVMGGKTALPNQKGEAILIDGTWKVGAASFCSLLALEQVKPAICAKLS